MQTWDSTHHPRYECSGIQAVSNTLLSKLSLVNSYVCEANLDSLETQIFNVSSIPQSDVRGKSGAPKTFI